MIKTEKPQSNKQENEAWRAYKKVGTKKKVYDFHFRPWQSTLLLSKTRKKKNFTWGREAMFFDTAERCLDRLSYVLIEETQTREHGSLPDNTFQTAGQKKESQTEQNDLNELKR